MAIKISNTTVIDDSRQLANIAGLDATTVTTMKNAGIGGINFVKKTANYTAVDKDGIIADTSAGSFTVTLPASPTVGMQVHIADGANWGTNNLTVARNGSTIEGVADNLTLDKEGSMVTLIYDGVTWSAFTQFGVGVGTLVTLDGIQTLTNKTINFADNTLTGVASTSTAQTLTNKIMSGFKEVHVAMAANNIDLASGNFFSKTLSGNVTLTVSNVPASNVTATFILELTKGGAYTITWWSGIKWASGIAPTLTAAGRDVLGFFTRDGGTTWTGLVIGKDVK